MKAELSARILNTFVGLMCGIGTAFFFFGFLAFVMPFGEGQGPLVVYAIALLALTSVWYYAKTLYASQRYVAAALILAFESLAILGFLAYATLSV